ncbi:MAG TPA: hypothetical protein VK044_01125 [Virgibacillus sp.]|nr:hypothetical protein [Virgibacillus sp.]
MDKANKIDAFVVYYFIINEVKYMTSLFLKTSIYAYRWITKEAQSIYNCIRRPNLSE